MKIVGVGCGPGLLTEEAISVIRSATLIYASGRAIEIARPHIRAGCVVKTIDDFKALHTIPDNSVVLSTGDPMLAGLGYLDGDVVPGISSLQLAAAKLRIPLARIVPVVAHGTGHERGMKDTMEELGRRKIVFLLTDPKFNIPELYLRIGRLGIPVRIAVVENLGYPEERIATGTIDSPPYPAGALYSLMIGDY
jgi:cobalt-precorrin-7 (C5)-methyltransferase